MQAGGTDTDRMKNDVIFRGIRQSGGGVDIRQLYFDGLPELWICKRISA
jgi:hypothetical protein